MANYNPAYVEIAANFVDHFYKVFQSDRSQLQNVYHPEFSMLTFEGSSHQGRQAIHEKYVSLPFGVRRSCCFAYIISNIIIGLSRANRQ